MHAPQSQLKSSNNFPAIGRGKNTKEFKFEAPEMQSKTAVYSLRYEFVRRIATRDNHARSNATSAALVNRGLLE